jgi:hypothetical protein
MARETRERDRQTLRDAYRPVPTKRNEVVPYQAGPNRTASEQKYSGTSPIPGTARGRSHTITLNATAARAALRAAMVASKVARANPWVNLVATGLDVVNAIQHGEEWFKSPDAYYGPRGWEQCCTNGGTLTHVGMSTTLLACNTCPSSNQALGTLFDCPTCGPIGGYDFTQTIGSTIRSFVLARQHGSLVIRWGYGYLWRKPSGVELPSPRRLTSQLPDPLPAQAVKLSYEPPPPRGDLAWPEPPWFPRPRKDERKKGLAQRGYVLAARIWDKGDELSQAVDILWNNLAKECRGRAGKSRMQKVQDIVRCAGTMNLPEMLADFFVNEVEDRAVGRFHGAVAKVRPKGRIGGFGSGVAL